ncbi:protein of unknown function [Pseudomonas mediterranea]
MGLRWTQYLCTTPYLWEPGLPAMAAAQPTLMQADPGLSRASSAPTWDRRYARHLWSDTVPCGSEPARDGGGPANIDAS